MSLPAQNGESFFKFRRWFETNARKGNVMKQKIGVSLRRVLAKFDKFKSIL
jgi:hypothetical protein